MKKTIATLALLISSSSLAEYRAYQYVVVNKIPIVDQPKTTVITSTLDPQSYVAYHGGYGLVGVDLLRTWICPGYTGKREICPSPYASLPQEVLQ